MSWKRHALSAGPVDRQWAERKSPSLELCCKLTPSQHTTPYGERLLWRGLHRTCTMVYNKEHAHVPVSTLTHTLDLAHINTSTFLFPLSRAPCCVSDLPLKYEWNDTSDQKLHQITAARCEGKFGFDKQYYTMRCGKLWREEIRQSRSKQSF